MRQDTKTEEDIVVSQDAPTEPITQIEDEPCISPAKCLYYKYCQEGALACSNYIQYCAQGVTNRSKTKNTKTGMKRDRSLPTRAGFKSLFPNSDIGDEEPLLPSRERLEELSRGMLTGFDKEEQEERELKLLIQEM